MVSSRASVVLALALPALGSACAQAPDPEAAQGGDEIISVPQTDVERDSIGLSWMYAYASWVETMHGTADPLDVSPAYWAYWHWFDQIAAGYGTTIATGGNWATANSLVTKYGLASERAFLAGGNADSAAREQAALVAIAASLENGVLSLPEARRDRLTVRRELDRAWALSPDVSAALDHVFGDHVTRSFLPLHDATDPADTTGTPVLRASDVTVSYAVGPGAPVAQKHLPDAMHEWRNVYYQQGDRAAFFARIQGALRDAQPVILTWFVDFDALEARDNGRLGSFNLLTLNELGPGTQGGHTTIVEGAALDPNGQLTALRVRNAWGAAHPDRAYLPGMPDRHDLWLDYLDGPVKRCVVRGGTTDTTNCPFQQVPLQDVVLPPGY